ncbi:MAG TPA: xanthine dehydrogenase family protein subunit M [Gemmatimonadales bacterium]|nr:xanthine dehydrogenase family protein subunit M [Gemmatimonadales bacterium]
MKPAPFRYLAPRDLDEALGLLEEHGPEAKPLAGGQSLVPAMNFRLAVPAVLVDLNRIDALAGIGDARDGGLRIGAMTRQSLLERDPRVAERAPLLRETMPHVAHPPIRNRGTVGGSLAHADPAAELPAVMVALGATLRCRSRRGERRVAADAFFLGPFATALEPGELLTGIDLPPPAPRTGWAFEEVARRHGDFALAGAAAAVELDALGACRSARVVLFGVGEGPVVSAAAGAQLAGARPDARTIGGVARAAAAELDPAGDIHATSAYRKHLAEVLVRRTVSRAAARAGGSAR